MSADGSRELDMRFMGDEMKATATQAGGEFKDWMATRPGQFADNYIDVLDGSGDTAMWADVNCATKTICARTCKNSCPVVGTQGAVDAANAAVAQGEETIEQVTEVLGDVTEVKGSGEQPTPAAAPGSYDAAIASLNNPEWWNKADASQYSDTLAYQLSVALQTAGYTGSMGVSGTEDR